MKGGTIWISRLKEGGVACRSGKLQAGDAILSINGVSLEHCHLEDAMDLLVSAGNSVTLTVAKEACEFHFILTLCGPI